MAFTARGSKEVLIWVASESLLLDHLIHFWKLISSLTHNSWKVIEKLPGASVDLVNMQPQLFVSLALLHAAVESVHRISVGR